MEDFFTLIPGINITNSEEKKSILTADILSMIGQIEFQHLMKSTNFITCVFDKENVRDGVVEPFLLAILLWVSGLFESAWILSDHCFECDAAYLFHYKGDELVQCTNNFLAQRTTLADCSTQETAFDLKKLVEWEKLDHRIQSYIHNKESGPFRFVMENGFSRSARALQYIKSARTAPNVGFKIAQYISAFEALFSTTTSELSHKLSERVAFFLSSEGFDKKDVFEKMKQAYEIRSRFVHGDNLSQNKIQNITNVSVTCDNYLRKIMQLLFGEKNLVELFDVSPKKLDEYFDKLIFG